MDTHWIKPLKPTRNFELTAENSSTLLHCQKNVHTQITGSGPEL